MPLWMRNRFLLLLLSLSLATVCENTSRAAVQPLKERVDSLWTLANEHALYGRYAESIAVCRDLLDNYRLSGDARKSIVWLILSDANNAGDYRLWCQYARPRYAGKPARKYYKALAAQPPQALSRPDRDVTVPYSVGVFFGVSLFYALLGKKRTVAPLEIKLNEYRQSAEQATGLTP